MSTTLISCAVKSRADDFQPGAVPGLPPGDQAVFLARLRQTNDDIAVALARARPSSSATFGSSQIRIKPSAPLDGGASLCGNVALIASKASGVIEIEIN